MIHYSDRGVQGGFKRSSQTLASAGCIDEPQGRCGDNAPMESFFHTLTIELVHRNYKTRAEAQRDIPALIEGFYSRTGLYLLRREIHRPDRD